MDAKAKAKVLFWATFVVTIVGALIDFIAKN